MNFNFTQLIKLKIKFFSDKAENVKTNRTIIDKNYSSEYR